MKNKPVDSGKIDLKFYDESLFKPEGSGMVFLYLLRVYGQTSLKDADSIHGSKKEMICEMNYSSF